MAAGADVHATRVLSIEGEPESEPIMAQTTNAAAPSGAVTTPVIAGDIEITAHVRVRLQLE